jgi:hypothetical protein
LAEQYRNEYDLSFSSTKFLSPFFKFPVKYLNALEKGLEYITDEFVRADVVRGLLGENPDYETLASFAIDADGLETCFRGYSSGQTEGYINFSDVKYFYFRAA